ncbi:hypothetical protein Sjap_022349 [Stephania japonica]|uniref:Uncharacterized protein n=1 Tax=Stephania japonica TaxID=461633 RepID=A0AAP0HTM0_9MAGN
MENEARSGSGPGSSSTSNILPTENTLPTERSIPSSSVGHGGGPRSSSASNIWQTEMSVPSPAIGHGGGPPLSKYSKSITAAAPDEIKKLTYNKKLELEAFRPTTPGHSPGIGNGNPPSFHQ